MHAPFRPLSLSLSFNQSLRYYIPKKRQGSGGVQSWPNTSKVAGSLGWKASHFTNTTDLPHLYTRENERRSRGFIPLTKENSAETCSGEEYSELPGRLIKTDISLQSLPPSIPSFRHFLPVWRVETILGAFFFYRRNLICNATKYFESWGRLLKLLSNLSWWLETVSVLGRFSVCLSLGF